MQMSQAQIPKSKEDAVMTSIFTLFEGMRRADSAMVRSVAGDDIRMQTVKIAEGKPQLVESSFESFLVAIGTPHDEVWDEPIWNYQVQVDGNLAHAWTPYAFYRGEKFSHCGVDSFQLYFDCDKWKIVSVIDTRQTENCQLPPKEKMLRALPGER